MISKTTAVRKIQWGNLGFFLFTGIVGTIGAPLYVYFHGLTLWDTLLFVFYFFATGMSITVGYHRLFSHVTYKAHPVIQFLLLFFGSAAFEQSALKWSAQHRTHHTFVDTERDPYTVEKGFWYAHIGWLVFWKQPTEYENVTDLQKNKLVMFQHKYFNLCAWIAGVMVPVLIGALWGRPGGAFLLTVCFRIAFVHHMTFCINSVCHKMGNKTYDLESSARDHWFVALFTFGEGYHNFHHRFPSDYRNGIRWYHWDPSKWMIGALNFMGLVSDTKTVSPFRILYARITAQKLSVHKSLFHSNLEALKLALDARHAKVQKALERFEHAAVHYRKILNDKKAGMPDFQQIKDSAFQGFQAERTRFKKNYQVWKSFLQRIPAGV
jgi:stearoyl-CoA desaturase (Delta-9 desaturase)